MVKPGEPRKWGHFEGVEGIQLARSGGDLGADVGRKHGGRW